MCIYGPDADLIHLALTTHLPFVCIFREQLKPRTRITSACKRSQRKDSFDFLWINVLREYFSIEFSPLQHKMGDRYNVEKIIDDFIFLCFFVGNDFLPRVFCMDIKIGNFDKLIEIFKETLIESDGYINEKGVICWHRAVKLFKKIAEFELKFIGDKLEEQEASQKNAYRYKDTIKEIDSLTEVDNTKFLDQVEEMKEEYEKYEDVDDEMREGSPESAGRSPTKGKSKKGITPKKIVSRKGEPEEHAQPEILDEDIITAGIANVEDAKKYLLNYSNEEQISRLLSARVLQKDIKFMSSLVQIYRKDMSEARLFYYEGKFNTHIGRDPNALTLILTAYMQGLQFVLSYYYTGCPSWLWFYPYYYSPLISDLSNLMTHLNLPHITENLIKFETGIPYDPYKQLLLILPISNLHLLPEPLRKVVADENAPLHKYYPTEFDLDPFGAVFESEYIAKIPFVDEGLLDKEYNKGISQALAILSPDEALRNTKGHNLVYEWSDQAPENLVESSIPIYFDNFTVKVKYSKFEMEDLKYDPKKILDALPQGKVKIIL